MSDSLRSRLAAYAATRSDIISAYLFGSRATGVTHRDSDLDLGIVLDPRSHPTRSQRADAMLQLGADVIALTHINAVDVVVLNDAAPELGQGIVTRGERLYCRDASTDRMIARQLISRYADLRPFLDRTRRLKVAFLMDGAR
jgi:hypothetical protein